MQTFSLLTVSCVFALAVAYPSDFAQHNHAAQASNDVVHWSTGPNQSGATTLNNPENYVPDNKFVAKVDNGGANKDVKTEFGKVGKNLDKAWGIPTKTEHEKDAAKDHVTTTKVQSPTITTTAATTTAATTTAATTTAASTTAASTTASNTTTSTTTTSTTTSAPKYETKAATTTTSAPAPAPTPAPAPAPPTTFTETKVQTKDLPHAIESGPAGTGSVDPSNVHVNATTELPAQKDAKDVNAAQDVKTPLPTNEHIKSAELVDATVLKAHFAAAPVPAAEHGVKGETRAPAAATSQSLASASPAPAPAPGLSAPVPAPAAAPSSLSAADAPASAASKDEKSAEPKTAKDAKQETKNF